MKQQTILVIEDESPIRSMLRCALENANFTVLEAESADEAQKVLGTQLPQLILLDWMLPVVSGVTFTKQLKQHKLFRDIPIIMLTARAEEEHKIFGLNAGVDDYVVKPFSPRELLARIHAVLRRGPLKHPDGTLSVRGLSVDTQGQRVTMNDRQLKLGPLEYRMLCFFLGHQDRVYSRDELLTHVWGTDAYIDERTVDVHIRRLRRRLKPAGYDQFIQTVHGSGYRFSTKDHTL